MTRNIVSELVERAKRANERAVVKATEGFDDEPVGFDVTVRRDGTVRVDNRKKGTTYTVTVADVLPDGCDCPAKEYGHYDDDELCKHEVAVLSHLLTDALALFRLVRAAGGVRLAVSAPNADDPAEIVGEQTRPAGEIRVDDTPLPDYWRDKHDRGVSPDEAVATVRFGGSLRRYSYPGSTLRPSVAMPG